MSQEISRPCASCPTGTAIGKWAKFCEPCRAKKRTKPSLYVFTPQMDERLRTAYETRERLTRTLNQMAKETGWPKHVFRHRARDLGIARAKEKPWSRAEVTLLERHGWKSPGRLVAIFREAGFQRSHTSIEVKRKRLRIVANVNGYTAHALAQMLGVDPHKVTRWIRLGWLKARERGTARTEAQGGDMLYIPESSVRQFILAHPLEISPGRADWLWLLDLVTEGKVGADTVEREDGGGEDDEAEAAA